MNIDEIKKNRRPITSRDTNWAKKVTSYLVKNNMSPNKISFLSILFSAFGAICLFFPQYGGFFLFAFFILLRLLCNLFDGMVAIEMKLDNPLGNIYNEFPDRITDTILIVAAGLVSCHPILALWGALFAVTTAYIRIFGGSLGFVQDFQGPQSKS